MKKGIAMKRVMGLCLVLLLGGARGAVQQGETKDTHEALLKEILDTLKQTVEVMESVKDEASARKAQPTLKKHGEQLLELQKRLDALQTPPREVKELLQKRFGKDINATLRRMKYQTDRLRDVKGGSEALAALQPPRKKDDKEKAGDKKPTEKPTKDNSDK